MKVGLGVSVAAHVVVLGWGLITLSAPQTHNTTITEYVPITMAEIGDTLSAQKGDQSAPVTQKPAPKPTTKPQEKMDAQNIGDGKLDSEQPLKPKEPPRPIEATPPPSGKPESDPDTVVVPEKPKEKTPEKGAAEAIEVKPKAQEKQSETQEVQEKPETEPKVALPNTNAPVPMAKPQQVAATTERKPVSNPRASASSAQGKESIDDILSQETANLDRRVTQGGGAKRSNDPAGFGAPKTVGNDGFQDTVQNRITACVRPNWNLIALAGSGGGYDLVVKAEIRLDQAGNLTQEPQLSASGGMDDNQRQVAINQARAALIKCSGQFMLPPDRYGEWNHIILNMKPMEQ